MDPDIAPLLVLLSLFRLCFLSAASTTTSLTAPLSNQDLSQLADVGLRLFMLGLQPEYQLAGCQGAGLDQQLSQHLVVFRQGIDEVDVLGQLAVGGIMVMRQSSRTNSNTSLRAFLSAWVSRSSS